MILFRVTINGYKEDGCPVQKTFERDYHRDYIEKIMYMTEDAFRLHIAEHADEIADWLCEKEDIMFEGIEKYETIKYEED